MWWRSEGVSNRLRQADDNHLPDGHRCVWFVMEDDAAYRRFIVGTIVDREMACQDDHWNDEMDTRPDVSWQGRLHNVGDLVEFCGRPHPKHIEAWISAYIEAEDEVIELRFGGHARARAILDLPYEMAFTCDDCGLWSFVGHKSPNDAFSEEERSGSLFSARSCDRDAVSKLFGKPIDPNSVWVGEKPDYTPIISGSDLRGKRDRREYEMRRKEKRRLEREAKRAQSTS